MSASSFSHSHSRSRRVIGLIAAIGFSLALWGCIAMAALGFFLKLKG